jgi:hypothetical protein
MNQQSGVAGAATIAAAITTLYIPLPFLESDSVRDVSAHAIVKMRNLGGPASSG